MNLYFLGRYSGHWPYKLFPFIKENFRPGEFEGIKNTHSINNADILFFRNKPEKTTDLQFQTLSNRISKYTNHCKIVNGLPIKKFTMS